MLKIKLNKNTRLYIIIALLSVTVILTVFGTVYALKNNHKGYVISSGDLPVKFTADASQVDSITLPTPTVTVNLDTLPKTNGTLTDIDFKTFKLLFQTSKRSILTLEKDGCSYCQDFEPKFINALDYFKATAYKINISNLSEDELSEIYNYIDFTGTPTTYIISNGKAIHTYTGTADQDTLSSFIDYFYIRNN